MASRKVTIDNLGDVISGILEEYGDEVTENIDEVTKSVGKAGVKALKSASGIFGGSGKYQRGWTSKLERERYGSMVTLYNGRVPGLPHLLENGHAKRGGGRVPGRTHIAPVEEELVKQFGEQIEKAVTVTK